MRNRCCTTEDIQGGAGVGCGQRLLVSCNLSQEVVGGSVLWKLFYELQWLLYPPSPHDMMQRCKERHSVLNRVGVEAPTSVVDVNVIGSPNPAVIQQFLSF